MTPVAAVTGQAAAAAGSLSKPLPALDLQEKYSAHLFAT